MDMEQAWMGVVSAEHAAIGAEKGWIQLNHGKRNNLRRLRRGDGFVFYSSKQRMSDTKPLRAVTQLGVVADDEPYQADEMMSMGAHGTFRPWRRDVAFEPVTPVAIADVVLELTSAPNWGYALRYGLVPLSLADFETLRGVMSQPS
ncbi:EVE domain-containing protein [Kineosporia mesophila]|uniref:EVE domain-containing protein n=1 Tax=Kineosporia mesophila TaxID=566012 RepID=A0ABP7AKD2_9ACTN|nr:EVE domain-containing protein [Kineosporia mesophila]MCD5352490.1 EVE domain-containing protein [Kineosporia mesophila]